MIDDFKMNGQFHLEPAVPRIMWREAQSRIELGWGSLIKRKVIASNTMWSEFPGVTAQEKAQHMQLTTFLHIRRNPVAASNTLVAPLSFGDIMVRAWHF